jgi:hypothetical protein
MLGPLMFGFIMDRGAPQWVFGASVIVMILTAAVALISDRRSARRRGAARDHTSLIAKFPSGASCSPKAIW